MSRAARIGALAIVIALGFAATSGAAAVAVPTLTAPASAALPAVVLDDDGAIVIGVEIAPRSTCDGVCLPDGPLVRTGVDAALPALIAVALALAGVLLVAVRQRARRQ